MAKTGFLGLALVVFSLPALSLEHPSLAGTWVPDAAASTEAKELKAAPDPQAPPAPPAPPAAGREPLPTIRIAQAGPRLTIDFLEADGSTISSTRLTADGKESLNPRAGGALIHRSTSTWDGGTLVTRWSLEKGSAIVISGTDRREITSPGTLVVTTTTEDAKSRSRSVIVYRKRG